MSLAQMLQQMQEKGALHAEHICSLLSEMKTMFDMKVDNVGRNEVSNDLDATVETGCDTISLLRLDVDAWRREVDEILGMNRADYEARFGAGIANTDV